ncbi:MAG: 2-hydroxyacyl-CoA dehydratase [Planctomycetes bacterium]|nr:2-hydroxyacyl-CoA dehydratase [Planctomycetota bacterium]
MNQTKTIIYSCPFVPPEWIAAHGLHPSRILPRSAKAATSVNISIGLCPFTRAFIHETITYDQAAGVIVTTTCDQMRRGADFIQNHSKSPLFILHVPTTWQTAGVHKYYLDELKRLSRFLEELGGTAPSHDKLIEVMLNYQAKRNELRTWQGQIPARQYTEAIINFNRHSRINLNTPKQNHKTNGIPVALVGGPIMTEDLCLFDQVAESGGQIVLDGTTGGERTLAGTFNRRQLPDDPLMELVQTYFGGIPDAFRRPNSQLYEWLKEKLSEREVRAIIFHRYLWCDTWHVEVQRLKEWTDLPVLDLDGCDNYTNTQHRTQVRIQALMEMLS